MEIWKRICDTKYFVSSLGRIKDDKNKIKKLSSCRGYLYVNLFFDNKWHFMQVHRLVALAFIPNPENKREVDHINSIRCDNNVDNLRWATTKENANFYERKRKLRKKVICLTTGIKYNSVLDCAKYNNITPSSVSMVCRGQRKSASGLKFRFL